jgi:hypothetical protein
LVHAPLAVHLFGDPQLPGIEPFKGGFNGFALAPREAGKLVARLPGGIDRLSANRFRSW